MKNLKLLSVAAILTCSVALMQTKAQAHVERGSEDKPLLYEFGGEQYSAWAYIEYQFVGTPSQNFNWKGHGYITQVSIWDDQNGWVLLDHIPLPKKTIKADDPRDFVGEETVKINSQGKVMVSAHRKNEAPWWL